MIPRLDITAWGNIVPWVMRDQIEHDLVLSRALCELYTNPIVKENLVFRGGTALHKLFFDTAGRFSEDLDFVQVSPAPIGKTTLGIREALDQWLGEPSYKQSDGRFTFYYKFPLEDSTGVRKLKIEINTREHYHVKPHVYVPFDVKNDWYTGSCEVRTHPIEEILATKFRALYQRKKGRDLYDFWYVSQQIHDLNIPEVIKIFQHYMEQAKTPVSRAQFERNLYEKQKDIGFNDDIIPLLSLQQNQTYQTQQAYAVIFEQFLPSLEGDSWKGLP
jgi:predicted nucleotidyltransferase component of viral defense system